MSHHCHQSCSGGNQSCSSHSCGEQCCSCHSCKCACHNHDHHEKYSHELLDLADEAWMEVLKDKIKEEIKQLSGEHLTQMAKLVATSNHARWKEKMLEKKGIQDFEDHLHQLLFNSSQCCQKK